ncbi:ABC transporter permease [Paenibacillus paeoniae]|uniref:ABC transporter permease n=1 Tax=Paenibacillus paeoniae TaxID=2292705 RepID=A0A371PKC9_9BACL|nr:ABC transporter permease [Paenibacillus paeoniae]REK76603.1 ABC transporter permease [Paenibacillus paeoniae]
MRRNETRGRLGRFDLINPVLDKEIKLRMRSPRTMWTLFFYLLAIGFLAFVAIYLTQELSGRNGAAFNPEQSKMLFYFLTMAQLGLVAFMAPGLTAGVISGEREKQTLNLLLTTQQSSATIIISKLLSSLSFMVLIVLSTIPIYSMVFLYGGISPKQLVLVFLFYLFIMLTLGSIGIFFSTLLKRTMLSVISTYGVTLFIFAGTAMLYFVMLSITTNYYYSQPAGSGSTYNWVGHIIAMNPVAALMSILEPSLSDQVFMVHRNAGPVRGEAPMPLWLEFMLAYTIISAIALWIAVRKLRPVSRRRR